ncbi:hypothetical protein BGC07_18615 [Piscirickettsia litoralis]|uniref:NlpC/P60 domain-containing protein n=1 Tax=Piscirickettsia litoralis TaxID=1891921 RepID=A0ABX2ZXU1_9GAMM|nr:hypothetical protein BGC07_18615 [Piscirickettsia litoralis]
MQDSKALSLFKAHALAEYPREAVGLIFPDDTFLPCVNLSNTPEVNFTLDPTVLIDVPEDTILMHSHPDSSAEPSVTDMVGQRDTGLLWGIVSLNQNAVMDTVIFGENLMSRELLNRPFIHGVFDCYSLIRDFYMLEMGILLADFPRQSSWWEVAKYDLYDRNFKEAGFIEMDKTGPLLRGDVLLMKVGRTTCINHGAIYLGSDCRLQEDKNNCIQAPDMILHHVCDNLSRREMLSEWQKRVVKVVRYAH